MLYSDSISDISSSADEELKVGDYVPVVQNPANWLLTYKGLDLTSTDREMLKFEIKTSDLSLSKKFGPFAGETNMTSSDKESCTIYAPYMQVSSSSTGSVFQINSNMFTDTTLSGNQFYVAMDVDVGGHGGINCTLDNGSFVTAPFGSVAMKLSPSSSDYDIAKYPAAGPGLQVQYSQIGDGSSAFAPPDGGAISIQSAVHVTTGDGLVGDMLNSVAKLNTGAFSTPQAPDMVIAVAEKAGAGTSNDFVDYWVFGASKLSAGTGGQSPSDALFQFNDNWVDGATTLQVFSDNSKLLYGHATKNPVTTANASCPGYYCGPTVSGPVNSNTELVETGYISERGSEFQSMDDRDVDFQMADKLANAQWFLAPASQNASTTSSTIVTLGEGESQTVNGVTVKVLQITESVGACSATGGAASCTADMSGVSAVIMPNNSPNVSVAMPYTGDYGNLVILDTDAVGVNTLISVGGDKVNSVTANLLQGSVDWTATKTVVKEVVQGSKIVVAGAQAEDTLTAAQDFVSQLKRV